MTWNQGIQSEEAGVKVAGGQVNHLLLHGGLGEAEPEGEYSQDEGGEVSQDEQEMYEINNKTDNLEALCYPLRLIEL